MIERLLEVPPVPAVSVQVSARLTAPSDGFLQLRVERLSLEVPGQARLPEFDYFRVLRPALDAVVVAPYFWASVEPGGQEPWVVLRSAVRPPAALRRVDDPCEEEIHGFWELPAGLIEAGEESAEGQRRAALRELREETGLIVSAEVLAPLGPMTFPCSGVIGERQTFFCAEVDPGSASEPDLDGSVLERAGRLIAVPLSAARRGIERGLVGDMKSELGLRRLSERLLG